MRKVLLIALLFIIACEERIDSDIAAANSDLIVVESVLTNELKQHRVKLTRPYPIQNAEEIPVTDAFVVIGDSDDNLYFLREFPRNSGNYFTDSIRAVFGKSYFLLIRIDGKEYTAFDNSPVGQPLGPIIIEEGDESEEFRFKLGFDEFGNVPNYVVHGISWFDSPACTSSCAGVVTHYDLKTVDVQNTFAPEKDDFYFPRGSRIIRKKFNVSDRYQTYLRSLLTETEWRGGFFDIAKENVKTNLSEGAIGFFAVTTVVTDTIYVRP